jgi:glycosyltransferase involved in cell wall biosynthesis
MIIVFIHQNFPAQYAHVASYLAQIPQNRVFFITQSEQNQLPRVIKLIYKPEHPNLTLGLQPGLHPYTGGFDAAVRTGAAVADVCRRLRDGGIVPDMVVGHAGWGETLFVKDVFPNVPVLSNFEFFYHAQGADVGFDPEFAPARPDDGSRLAVRNAINRMSFAASDWGHTATAWQRSLYPAGMQARISMLHEGVDTERVRPDSGAWLKLAREDIVLSREDVVITYAARNLEPYRGFPTFMRALPEILRRHPRAQVLIAGADGVSYGDPPAGGGSYNSLLQSELKGQLDLNRVHFLGHVSYELYLNLLQISTVHVYLTYPFVLSWSFIEAMAAGCLIVGSATAPVLEVLEDGVNGLTTDFFSSEDLAERVAQVLEHPDRMQALRDAARATAVTEFDLSTRILPQWVDLIGDLTNGIEPPAQPVSAGLATRAQLR